MQKALSIDEALIGALIGEVRSGHGGNSHLFVLRAPDLLATRALMPSGKYMGRFYTDFEDAHEALTIVSDRHVSFNLALRPPAHAWLPRSQEPVVYDLKAAKRGGLGGRFVHAALKRSRPAYLGRLQHGMDAGIPVEVQTAYHRGGLSVSEPTLQRIEKMLRHYHPGLLR